MVFHPLGGPPSTHYNEVRVSWRMRPQQSLWAIHLSTFNRSSMNPSTMTWKNATELLFHARPSRTWHHIHDSNLGKNDSDSTSKYIQYNHAGIGRNMQECHSIDWYPTLEPSPYPNTALEESHLSPPCHRPAPAGHLHGSTIRQLCAEPPPP